VATEGRGQIGMGVCNEDARAVRGPSRQGVSKEVITFTNTAALLLLDELKISS